MPLLVPVILVRSEHLLRPVAGVDREPVGVLVPVVVVHAEEGEHVVDPTEDERAHVSGVAEVPRPRDDVEVVARRAGGLEPQVPVQSVVADDCHLVPLYISEEPRLIAFATLAHV